jgi:hypothetical protein
MNSYYYFCHSDFGWCDVCEEDTEQDIMGVDMMIYYRMANKCTQCGNFIGTRPRNLQEWKRQFETKSSESLNTDNDGPN